MLKMVVKWLDFRSVAALACALRSKSVVLMACQVACRPDYDRLVDSECWVIRAWAEAYEGYAKEVLLKRADLKGKIEWKI